MSEAGGGFPAHSQALPYVTTAQMVEVDRAMIEDYHIALIQMMENAGRNLADLARRRFLGGGPRGRRVVVLAGSGGNGGGAMVCARRLHNWGADVQVLVTKPEWSATSEERDAYGVKRKQTVPARQADILRRMGVAVATAGVLAETATTWPAADLIVDGVIGYSLQGKPRGAAGDLIRWANSQGAPILALDAPSGVDTTSGQVFEPAIRATATMTLALPKEGLRAGGVADQVGELYLADISVPPALYAAPALGLQVEPIFARSEIVRLW